MHWRAYFIRLVWFFRGEKTYKKYKAFLKEEQFSKEQIRIKQNERLKEFINHCYENVPYYKQLFDNINLNPKSINSVDDLEKIPILTKEIVRENQELLIAKNANIKNLKRINTSGSTGKPLKLFDDIKNRNEVLLSNLWCFYSRCGWKPGEKVATIWGANPSSKNTLFNKVKNFLMGTVYLNAWEANDENFKDWYLRLKKGNVKVLVCYSSVGARFARWIIDNRKKALNIKGVYTTSEMLLDKQKDEIKKAFDCQVYNLYGCGEVLAIGCSCSEGEIHINETQNIVEIGKGRENNPIILTGLQNRVMPFLRYQNGDSITINNKLCSCGRKSNLLGLKITRMADTFLFKNGKSYAGLYFILRLYKEGFDGIELFQFHQVDINNINLKILKNSRFNDKTMKALSSAIEEIESHIEYQAKVNLIFVEKSGFGENLKHSYAKSDISKP